MKTAAIIGLIISVLMLNSELDLSMCSIDFMVQYYVSAIILVLCSLLILTNSVIKKTTKK